MRSDLCDLELIVIHQTEKAMLLGRDETDNKGEWVPKSRMEVNAARKAKGKLIVLVTMEQTLAEEKGFV